MLKEFLAGCRVLDLSQFLPGPYATRMLADMGAHVVKVEPPGGEPLRHMDLEGRPGQESPFYSMLNAGKSVIFLDLKTDSGRAELTDLIERADILMESFRPGVMDRLGFPNDRLRQINRRLVHCALSGFGQTGPYRNRPGHDVNYVALSGGQSVTGTDERPAITLPPISDYAGALQAVIVTLGALRARERTGEGAFLDVSTTESLLAWQGPSLSWNPPRGRGIINGGAGGYNLYRTADDRFVSLSPLEPKFWQNFCNAVGHPEWIERRFEPMPQSALIADIAAMFAAEPLAHWDAVLDSVDCCYQPVVNLDEVPDHPQHKARGLVYQTDMFRDVVFPTLVDGMVPEPRLPHQDTDVAAVRAAWAD